MNPLHQRLTDRDLGAVDRVPASTRRRLAVAALVGEVFAGRRHVEWTRAAHAAAMVVFSHATSLVGSVARAARLAADRLLVTSRHGAVADLAAGRVVLAVTAEGHLRIGHDGETMTIRPRHDLGDGPALVAALRHAADLLDRADPERIDPGALERLGKASQSFVDIAKADGSLGKAEKWALERSGCDEVPQRHPLSDAYVKRWSMGLTGE